MPSDAKDLQVVLQAQQNTLTAFARTLPGSDANGVPLMAKADPVGQTKINAKSAQAQAVLELAKNRLTATQQMLSTSQENYMKATDLLFL